ncbi:hypothetical protein TPR58_04020 [Sphingomonas sp. HF-S3]|uniref:Uncharacterized protein n=1 Tax=Sphingomonas rustica TaxID=3103142 RepID=A0ABV0B7G2_9SPHN
MTEFFLFMYAMTALFVLTSMRRNQQERRSSSPALVLAGWGLFSLSSTLALLMAGVAVAIAMGMQVPLATFEALF